MPRKPKSRLTTSQNRLIARARKMGAGKTATKLDDMSLAAVMGFLERDLAEPGAIGSLPDIARPSKCYFETDPLFPSLSRDTPFNLEQAYLEALEVMEDFERAFECLCEIQLRRVKFANIRSTQPLPEISSIAYRGLLEDGILTNAATSTMMRLRKHLYDIDNRAAQEAAYMHTKIIANALQGQIMTSKNSPIRKAGDQFKRRSVDCIVGDRAYDFKGRLTEAPSKRARFDDELMFPRDCSISGFQPILLAFNQEPGERSTRLIEAYERYDGLAFIGDEAWRHLREAAGPVMARFLDTYLISPMEDLTRLPEKPMDMTIRVREGYIDYIFKFPKGRVERLRVPRPKDPEE
ncbi:hypothetical protein KUV57_13765 [Epibacterium sp. DP7N7-1]|nr:hypothetical protein [Epibacterium sp. DP7N7-1]